jgi:polysaccharide pyruvyl transferase WcaK-like protein
MRPCIWAQRTDCLDCCAILIEQDMSEPHEPILPQAASRRVSAPTTIAVLGLFGSPNLGNEATLAAFMHHVTLRLPGVRFVCIAPRQSTVAKDYGIQRIDLEPYPIAHYFWRVQPPWFRGLIADAAQWMTEMRRHRRAAQLLSETAVLAMPGTGLIDDFGQGPLDMPSHLDRWTAAAKGRGIPVSFVSMGVSQVKSALSRALFRRSLARADDCSFRDEASAQNAARLGYPHQAEVLPDLAFSVPMDAVARRGPTGDRPVIGVGVMGYFGWNCPAEEGRRIYGAYLNRLCTLVNELLRNGRRVRLLIGDTRADVGTVADVKERCGAASPDGLMAEPIGDFRGLLAQIAQTDVVVATRFHNVLFALMLERPTISIGYSDKNDAVMAAFGMRGLCHSIETFDPDTVLRQVGQLLQRPDEAVIAVRPRLDEMRARLDAQYDTLCARWSTRLRFGETFTS